MTATRTADKAQDKREFTDAELESVRLKLNAARLIACEKQPYLSMALFAMVLVRVDGLGTMASDDKWRVYYDPAKVIEWPVTKLAGVILHEAGHCLRGHGPRFVTAAVNRNLHSLWNIAGDALINDDLHDDRVELPEGAVYIETLKKEGVAAERTQSVEQLFQLLLEKAQESCTCGKGEQGEQSGDQQGNGEGSGSEQGEQSGDGAGSESGEQQGNGGGKADPNCPMHGKGHKHSKDGKGNGGVCLDPNCPENDAWDCGSAADGVRRDYEAEGDKVDQGVDADRADLIRQQVAVEVVNHSKNRGTVPAGYERWAKELLDPTVDWRKELASIVRRAFAQVAGLRDYTYSRPSRRDAAMRQRDSRVILPAMRQPAPPSVSIVIDTSGSMSDEMLSWALSETQGVLRALGSSGRGIRVISCDAQAVTQRVTKASNINLKGGGGTDMRVGIEEAMSVSNAPDLVIVLTDGYTPWPDVPLKGATLIVGLTDEDSRKSVPEWARTVLIKRD